MNSYWDIRQLSVYLHVKPSTLYSWAAQRKIPCVRIHGLIRFRAEDIEAWLAGFAKSPPALPEFKRRGGDIDTVIARAKRAVYTSACEKLDEDRAKQGG